MLHLNKKGKAENRYFSLLFCPSVKMNNLRQIGNTIKGKSNLFNFTHVRSCVFIEIKKVTIQNDSFTRSNFSL